MTIAIVCIAAPAVAEFNNTGDTAGQNSFAHSDFQLWSCTGNFDFDDFSLTSATSNLKGNFGMNFRLSPGFFSSHFFPKMFAQEMRANSTGCSPPASTPIPMAC